MFTITTTASVEKTTATATIDGKRRQRTVKNDSMAGMDARHGAAAGALLDVLLDDRQKAMLRHPSGGQRVQMEYTDLATAVQARFVVNV